MSDLAEPTKEKLATSISVRFGLDELDRLRVMAEREGVSLSALIRRSVLNRDEESGFVVRTGSPNRGTSSASFTGGYEVGSAGDVVTTGGDRSITAAYP